MGIPWKKLFAMGVWQLWLHRNNFIFKTEKVEHLSSKRCIKDGAEYYSIGINAKLPKTKAVIPVGWTRPPEGWAKLNSNGFALGNPGRVGGGGVFLNHDGEWIKGYARPLGYTSSCRAKLWALRDSLMLAKEMSLNNLIVELDALSIAILMNNNTTNLFLEPLLTDCRNLLKVISNK